MKENKDFLVRGLVKSKLKSPILISGLPGVGNVGKITIDFLIDYFNSKRIFDIGSFSLPNCIFISSDGIVELPKLEVYHSKIKGEDFLFLTGDVQPTEERACYSLCEYLVGLFKELGVREIISLGGVGLDELPKKPKVFCAGTDNKIIKKYMDTDISLARDDNFGPIVGVAGVLVGLADKAGIGGVILLAETLNHPSLVGIKGAHEIINVLNKRFKLNVDTKELDKEISKIDAEISKKTKRITFDIGEDQKTKSEKISYLG